MQSPATPTASGLHCHRMRTCSQVAEESAHTHMRTVALAICGRWGPGPNAEAKIHGCSSLLYKVA